MILKGSKKTFIDNEKDIIDEIERRQVRKAAQERLKIKEKLRKEQSMKSVNIENSVICDSGSDKEFENEASSPPKKKKLEEVTVTLNIKEVIRETSLFFNHRQSSYRTQTGVLGTILGKCGKVDLSTINFSRNTVYRERKKALLEDAQQIKEDNKNLLKDSKLICHFDTKLVKEILPNGVNITRERLAVSVTSPNFTEDDDILLGNILIIIYLLCPLM